MRLTHCFEHFDPLTGELPDPYAVMFCEVVHRARSLLIGRTSEQLTQAALVINRIYHDPKFVDPIYQAFREEPIKTRMFGQEIDAILSFTDVEALYQNIGNVLLAEYQEFPTAQWYELFAVLALSYAEKVCSELHNQATWPSNHFLPKPTDSQINDFAQEYLGLARQAITYAETLKHQANTVKRLSSDQNRHAAATRHKPTGKLKAAVLALHQEKYTNRSNRDAASRILKELITLRKVTHDEETHQLFFENKLVLQTDDPEHRFEIWLGDANKPKV